VDSVDGTTTIATVTFTNPVSYAGFAWGTSDNSNEVDVYDGSTLLGSFFGDVSLRSNFYPFTTYFNIHADSGEAITSLVLSSNCCFETDNYSAIVPAERLSNPPQFSLRLPRLLRKRIVRTVPVSAIEPTADHLRASMNQLQVRCVNP